MKRLDKKIVAPIVAVICMGVQLIFGVEIPEVVQGQIVDAVVNVILVGATVYGIFHNYQREPEKNPDVIEKQAE